MSVTVSGIADAMIAKSSLPDRKGWRAVTSQSMGGPTFDKLHSALQRYVWTWREQDVEVIGHQHE